MQLWGLEAQALVGLEPFMGGLEPLLPPSPSVPTLSMDLKRLLLSILLIIF